MTAKPTLIGLYSFPKSGNTWVRRVVGDFFELATYAEQNAAIPDIAVDPIGQRVLVHGDRRYVFYKAHSRAEVTTSHGEAIRTDFLLHIRRNPLDVFLSYLNYLSGNLHDEAPVKFADVDQCARSGLLDYYFGAFLTLGHIDPRVIASHGSYFGHNLWWAAQADDKRVFDVRYEDLLTDFTGTLTPFWQACGLPLERLSAAAETLRQKLVPDGKFYWKMKRGTYLEYLDHNKVADFITYHEEALATLGYLEMLKADIGL